MGLTWLGGVTPDGVYLLRRVVTIIHLRQEDLKEPSTPGCIQLSDDAVAQVSLAAGGHLGPRNCVPHAPGDEGAGATRSAGQNAGAPQHHRTQRANAGGQVPVGGTVAERARAPNCIHHQEGSLQWQSGPLGGDSGTPTARSAGAGLNRLAHLASVS